MYGFRFIDGAGELPADAQRARRGVPVERRGRCWCGSARATRSATARRSGCWGTSTTIGTNVYGWGMPITLTDAAGNAAVVRIGDGNPDFHFGLSNNVTLEATSASSALVDAQVGGRSTTRPTSACTSTAAARDVDQARQGAGAKKPIDYYVALYAANAPTDYFVENAGFVKLREVSLQVPPRPRVRGPAGARRRVGRRDLAHRPQPAHADRLQGLRPRGQQLEPPHHHQARQLRLSALPHVHRQRRGRRSDADASQHAAPPEMSCATLIPALAVLVAAVRTSRSPTPTSPIARARRSSRRRRRSFVSSVVPHVVAGRRATTTIRRGRSPRSRTRSRRASPTSASSSRRPSRARRGTTAR